MNFNPNIVVLPRSMSEKIDSITWEETYFIDTGRAKAKSNYSLYCLSTISYRGMPTIGRMRRFPIRPKLEMAK